MTTAGAREPEPHTPDGGLAAAQDNGAETEQASAPPQGWRAVLAPRRVSVAFGAFLLLTLAPFGLGWIDGVVLTSLYAAASAAVAYGTVPLLGRIAVTGEAGNVPLIGRFAAEAPTLPLVSATYTMLIGFIVMGLFAAPSVPTALRAPRRALAFVAMGGLAMSTGVSLLYLALSLAPVVVVSPVFALNAFVALVLAHFFLQRLERVTPPLVIGTVLVVAGVVAVILGADA